MHDFRVSCAVDFEFPGPQGYPELATDWLVSGSRLLAGEYLVAIESGEPLDPGTVRRGGPAGPPGSVWGFVAVARGVGGSRRSARVYSAKSLAWLEKKFRDPAVVATLGVSVLDKGGYPDGSPLRATVQRVLDAEGWLTLSLAMQESRLARPQVQRSLPSFVRSVAERVNPSFGQCDYDQAGVERVFEVVAPVLPTGMPRRFDRDDRPPDRVAVRDAASVRARGV